ncbi:MAG: TonB family protein / TonB-dependent receptor [Labilithrix sp.]|nr:TonB family protein / TonB-dependent receptor [Labilithrix sp.]
MLRTQQSGKHGPAPRVLESRGLFVGRLSLGLLSLLLGARNALAAPADPAGGPAAAADPNAIVPPHVTEATAGPSPAPLAPPSEIDEVTIGGQRRPTSSPMGHRLGRADVRLIPGAFGDPYRAIEMLPGVVPTVSGLPYYYIRGAPPSAVGYFIDDVRVPYVFHFALGPGVIQPALIDEVTLHPAAFPARYGRYAGGIVAGKTREPAAELNGEALVRAFDAGAYVETPFAGGRGSAGVGGRYSYAAAVISLFSPDLTLDYRDYNARVTYDLSDRWRATAFTFGAYDYASQVDDTGREQVLFASEFHRLDLRLDRRGGDGSTSRIAMTLGLDRTRLEGSRFAQDMLLGVRARHRVPLRSDLDVEVGLDTTIDRYNGDLPSIWAVNADEYRDAEAFFSPRIETATGAWASGTWHPTKGFELTATARADVFTSDGATALGPSPRISMRVPVGRNVAFLGALGVAAQPPAFAIPVPAVGYRRLPGGLGFGYQKSAGAEVELPLRFTLRGVGFHHSYFNLRDFSRSSGDLDFQEPQPVPSSPAQAYGLEVSVRRNLTERASGFLSYTLSRSEFGPTQVSHGRVSPFDRTHVFQIGGAIDLGRGWRASARFLTYRGWPDEGTSLTSLTAPTRRLSPFVRLDGRVEKRWRWRQAGHIALVFEALNATATKEVIGRECNPVEGCRDREIGPVVVPSIGVEGAL